MKTNCKVTWYPQTSMFSAYISKNKNHPSPSTGSHLENTRFAAQHPIYFPLQKSNERSEHLIKNTEGTIFSVFQLMFVYW